jgi:hypothetical protein
MAIKYPSKKFYGQKGASLLGKNELLSDLRGWKSQETGMPSNTHQTNRACYWLARRLKAQRLVFSKFYAQ